MPTSSRPSRARRVTRSWARLSDEDLLSLRFCDLKLTLEGSALERRLTGRLFGELDKRGITFRPHLWLSEEWFSPDGVPGIAVPFYLAHPRLQRLERQMMREVEGGNANWMIRILRHEAGHAIDTAYRLRRRKRWNEIFGAASQPYPDRYRARPASRKFVHHLGDWYAQSHPTEDFAETFAVWLKPNSDWRRSYSSWPALAKLEYVDGLMRELRGRAPLERSRRRIECLDRNTRTLREHYAEKIAHHARARSRTADGVLQRVFTTDPKRRVAPRASTLLRSVKPRLVDSVAKTAGVDRYSVYQVLRRATVRAEQLKLRVRGSRRDALKRSRRMIAKLVRLYGEGSGQQLPL
jgi:hypothetical protein